MIPASNEFCRACGATLLPTSAFCSKCGTQVGVDHVPGGPNTPVCASCGAPADMQGAFCRKCGVPLDTGHEPWIPAPPPDRTPPPDLRSLRIGDHSSVRRGPRSNRWAVYGFGITLVLLVIFATLVVSGEYSRLTLQDKVYIVGVNVSASINIEGVPLNAQSNVACNDCPIVTLPGGSYSLIWEVGNAIPNSTLQYTAIGFAYGTPWTGTESPSPPFTLTTGQTQYITLTGTVPSGALGAYFVPTVETATVTAG